MATINSRASVDLIVNGKSAAEAMDKIKQRAEELRRKMDQCTLKGDIKGAQRFQRQLESLDKRFNKLKNSNVDFNNTLRNLDKASVKDLELALRSLQAQFKTLKRGSEEWNRQAQLIRRVRQEINNANAALQTASSTTHSFSERALNFFNKWQIAIVGVVGALSGFVMAGRKAVNEYAEMDEALANTMKFTGMTREQVNHLNEEFRKMDTRTAIKTLHDLAQEGGRLGKQTEEDVLGYVKAADIINVALSDLGKGATQEIAKLSNVFKIEDQYGTYDAMLKIGSVVNVLSQNCTASKPYLVEFAGRLAGVGNQAHITLQQIIGLGAVLDANKQKVEASATAIGQVLTRMYRDPTKYAKVVGLNIKEFSDLLKNDANEALLVFLESLGKAGDMNVLAPMFADMGENGARVIQALSTLSKHIDEVRWQQDNANKAFKEGTSVLHEYEIFNNTAQAGIDKAKKRIADLCIELGEKLMPVMRHVYTSGSLFLRMLSSIVDFLYKNRDVISFVVASVTVYYVALNIATIKTYAVIAATKTWSAMIKALPVSMNILKMAWAGVTNGIQYFTNGLKVNYDMQLKWRTAVAALGAMNPAKVFTVAAVAAVALGKVIMNLTAAYQKQKAAAETLTKIRDKAAVSVELEKEKINQLIKVAKDETESLEQRRVACDKLNQIIPNFNAQIDNQTKAFKSSTKALKDHIAQLTRYYELQGAKEELKTVGQELAQANIEVKNAKDELKKEQEANAVSGANLTADGSRSGFVTSSGGFAPSLVNIRIGAAATEKALEMAVGKAEKKAEVAKAKMQSIYDAFGVMNLMDSDNSSSDDEPDPDPDDDDDDGGYTSTVLSEKERKKREAEARRAAIKARKEFKEELNSAKGDWEAGDSRNIAEYTQGLKSWTEFLTEKHRLQEKFYDDQIAIFERHNLQEDEDYKELLKKKEQLEADWLKRKAAMAVDDAKLAQKAEEVQAQIDYSTPGNALFRNEEALQARLFDIRIKYLGKMREAYNRDSREYHDYTVQITQAEEEEKLRVRKRFAELYAKYSTEYLNKTAKEQFDWQISLLTVLQQTGQLSMEEFMKAVAKLRQETVFDSLPESARKQESPEESDQKAMQKDLAALKGKYDAQLMTEEEYLKAKERIEAYYQKKAVDRARQSGNEFSTMVIDLYEAFKAFGEDGDDNIWGKIGAAAQASFALMNAAMSAYTEFSKAQLDLQVARIEKRYEREAALAEGNVYKEKQAERKKQKEIAKAKNEANRKQFAMSVISAVAQTAVNAINAYGAGLQVGGPAGLVLAPIAAAMAIAAGMIQIATLRKQQQASEAQGYAEGGFTPKGRKNDPVGVVHAGEWVAPQEMVNSPATRPIINMLENARRNNRIGSIRYSDVSAASAPALAVRGQERKIVVETPPQQPAADPELTSAISRLNSRLNEPFVTVNTVTGDHGIRRAQDEYDRLMRNKSRR